MDSVRPNFFKPAGDNSDVVQRAMPLVGMEVKNSIMTEHGFSSFITVTEGNDSRSTLFDFGFSQSGAAYNARALGADLTQVEEMALSHGHLDHVQAKSAPWSKQQGNPTFILPEKKPRRQGLKS